MPRWAIRISPFIILFLCPKPAGSNAVLSSATAARPTFVADTVGVYVATLVVNDGRLNSNQVTIAITAAAP